MKCIFCRLQALSDVADVAYQLLCEAVPLEEAFNPSEFVVSGELLRRLDVALATLIEIEHVR